VRVLLAGLDIEKKAALVEESLFAALGGKDRFTSADVRLTRRPHLDPQCNEDALAELRITVTSPDPEDVGRLFSSRAVELALASVPGITFGAPPRDATQDIAFWPCLVGREQVRETLLFEGEELAIPPPPDGPPAHSAGETAAPAPPATGESMGPCVRIPLGRVFGARSGDKGSHANLGVWARTPAAYAFLRGFLSVEQLRALLPDIAPFPVERHELPNLLALNFVIRGLLEGGVASSARVDPQAKTLAEYFRARIVEIPEAIR
jgi:hypothetical protein